jgi:hypothetical protein
VRWRLRGERRLRGGELLPVAHGCRPLVVLRAVHAARGGHGAAAAPRDADLPVLAVRHPALVEAHAGEGPGVRLLALGAAGLALQTGALALLLAALGRRLAALAVAVPAAEQEAHARTSCPWRAR